jgi:hypothetical protein
MVNAGTEPEKMTVGGEKNTNYSLILKISVVLTKNIILV